MRHPVFTHSLAHSSNSLSSRVEFNVPPNTLGHIGDDLYGSDDSANSVKALLVGPPGKGPGQSHPANPSTRQSEVSIILENTYIAP